MSENEREEAALEKLPEPGTACPHRESAGRLKLFVVGERSPNPEDWRDACGRRAVVAAHSAEEAVRLADETGTFATEIAIDRPLVIADIHNPWPS